MIKPILCVDFDGVLHSYTTGWKGAKVVSDPPVPGAMAFLERATKFFKVCVYSSRSSQWGGKRAMKRWLLARLTQYVSLKDQDLALTDDPFNKFRTLAEAIAQEILDGISFPTKKPAAFLTIDDRAICFEGTFPDVEELLNFKTWTKKGV